MQVHWGFENRNAQYRGYLYDPSWLCYGDADSTTTDPVIYAPNFALLHTNDQVYLEASKASWERSRKCFVSARQILLALDASLTRHAIGSVG
jgi:hypothetical protein